MASFNASQARHIDLEDDGSSTQPVTSCCSEEGCNNDEQLEKPIQIHTSCDKACITWKNDSGQAQRLDNIPLKVDIDTLISKAIFKLTCWVWIKGKGKNKAQSEGINDDVSSLHFSMNQGHSRLVIPSDRVLECKDLTLTRLHLMKTLSEMDGFTMHFKHSDMTGLTCDHLLQIASIFSAANPDRPETDDRRTNLQTLYGGIGGHVFSAGITLAEANDEGDKVLPEDISAPPPFDHESDSEHKSYRKRKRERKGSDADYERAAMHHSPSTRESHIRSTDQKGLVECLLDMENRFKSMIESSENRLREDVKNMIESTEDRLRNHAKDVVESTEDRLRNHVNDVVEASENRLKSEMNDVLNHVKGLEDTLAADSRADDIEREVERAVDDLRTECIGTIESEFRYLKYGIEEVTKGMEEAEEKTKGVLGLLDEAGDGIERRVGRYLNGIRLQVTVDDK
ncbi:hypothetical protein GGI43DRAFT_387611 [Trichoderma evansii]